MTRSHGLLPSSKLLDWKGIPEPNQLNYLCERVKGMSRTAKSHRIILLRFQ
ncbi:TPA: hypothetical protein ACTM63_002919 [Yersinia enterocolitica]